MKDKCIAITQQQIIMKINSWCQKSYKTLRRIWKDSRGMVLASLGVSQTYRLTSDFKAWTIKYISQKSQTFI